MIAKADVVLALGTRLSPFSTLPSYGIDYWPKNAKIIQVDINVDRIGLTKKITVGIQGDAKAVAEWILEQLSCAYRECHRGRILCDLEGCDTISADGRVSKSVVVDCRLVARVARTAAG